MINIYKQFSLLFILFSCFCDLWSMMPSLAFHFVNCNILLFSCFKLLGGKSILIRFQHFAVDHNLFVFPSNFFIECHILQDMLIL